MAEFAEYRRFLKATDWKQWELKEHETDERKGLPRAQAQKPYPPDAKIVDLVAPEDLTIGDVSLKSVIAQRRSRRKYSDASLTLEELSYLLWATQGVTKTVQLDSGLASMRTVPSGGSMHEFEAYLAIDRVDGVEPGLYRYLPFEHKLVFLLPDSGLMKKVMAGCRSQEFVQHAAVVFMWTAIPYRMEWRYNIVAHKVIAQDSGHLCQNLYLAAESIGAGTCAIGAYDQEKIDELLGVDGEDEFVVYVAPVGKVE